MENVEEIFENTIYTSCYCEENIYNLSKSLLLNNIRNFDVIILSNFNKSVLLFNQSSSKLKTSHYPVIWDYHVILSFNNEFIVDFDTRLNKISRLDG